MMASHSFSFFNQDLDCKIHMGNVETQVDTLILELLNGKLSWMRDRSWDEDARVSKDGCCMVLSILGGADSEFLIVFGMKRRWRGRDVFECDEVLWMAMCVCVFFWCLEGTGNVIWAGPARWGELKWWAWTDSVARVSLVCSKYTLDNWGSKPKEINLLQKTGKVIYKPKLHFVLGGFFQPVHLFPGVCSKPWDFSGLKNGSTRPVFWFRMWATNWRLCGLG